MLLIFNKASKLNTNVAQKSAAKIGYSRIGSNSNVLGVCKQTVIREVRQASFNVKAMCFVSTNTKRKGKLFGEDPPGFFD
jgi:hypothetical protein